MGTNDLSGLTLILTTQCNLHCSYCYQHARVVRHMSRRTIRAALDRALRSSSARFKLTFYGGEPLLRFPQIRWAIGYLSHRTDQRQRFRFELLTNGLLLNPEKADYLEEHNFRVVLSFDGPGAQAARGTDTFQALEKVVERLRVRNPKLFQDLLSIIITLTPGTIRYLADSIEYFLQKGLRPITVSAALTHFPAWREEGVTELDDQLQRVVRCSQLHSDQTGKSPRLFLGAMRPAQSWDEAECGAVRLRAPAVDVDGQVYPCSLFARSLQGRERAPFAEIQALGRIDDPGLEKRLSALRTSGMATGLFAGRSSKHTEHGACSECENLDSCLVCPFSAAYIPGNRDPSRVSDFVCAFNRVACKYREILTPHPSQPVADRATQRLIEWLNRVNPHS